FFARFAKGIAQHELRARIVRISPGNLAQLTSGRARADLYLKFSERGSTVAFDKTQDLEAAELAQYSEYLPDKHEKGVPAVSSNCTVHGEDTTDCATSDPVR